jgi:hypothetical protein
LFRSSPNTDASGQYNKRPKPSPNKPSIPKSSVAGREVRLIHEHLLGNVLNHWHDTLSHDQQQTNDAVFHGGAFCWGSIRNLLIAD